MSKELAKLPREAIEAIEVMRAKGMPNNEIVERHIHGDHIPVNGFKSVDDLSTDTIIRALYIGYEIEETPEDKVREYYELQRKRVNHHEIDESRAEIRGMEFVLNAFNITIEGVNA